VIRPRGSSVLPAAVAEWFDVVALASGLGGWRVQWRGSGDSSAKAQLRLQQLLGPAFQVLPVLHGDDNVERFPTGHLIVRWGMPASDDDVKGLARSCGLELVKRSSFTDRQAVYRAAIGATDVDLNSVLAQVLHNAGVEKAWLEAESTFQRAP
jgi:hypothetical protein